MKSPNSIEHLSWDSQFMGYKVGKYTARNLTTQKIMTAITRAKEQGFILLYLSIPGKYITLKNFAKKNGGLLVDTKITYKRDISKSSITSESLDTHISSILHKKTSRMLNKLAISAGHFSRFFKDKNIKPETCRMLYKEWVRKSLTGELADNVLVYKDEKKILGFITYKISNRTGRIGLIAVSKASQGRSIGTKLMQYALWEMKERHVKTIEVVTQKANKSACAFYKKNGYDIYKKEYIFHFWL